MCHLHHFHAFFAKIWNWEFFNKNFEISSTLSLSLIIVTPSRGSSADDLSSPSFRGLPSGGLRQASLPATQGKSPPGMAKSRWTARLESEAPVQKKIVISKKRCHAQATVGLTDRGRLKTLRFREKRRRMKRITWNLNKMLSRNKYKENYFWKTRKIQLNLHHLRSLTLCKK